MKNNTTKKDIIVFYHGGCSDGFGAAWVAWRVFKDKALYIGAKYQMPVPVDVTGKEVYLLDFCYDMVRMKALVKKAKHTVVIDHHISQQEEGHKADEFVFDNNHSGAVLAWKYFYPRKKVPTMLRYVQDQDLWTWKLPASIKLGLLITTIPFDFKVWTRYTRMFDNTVKRHKLARQGKLLVEYRDRLVWRAIVKGAQKARMAGHTALVVNSPILESQIGSALVKKGADIGIIWHTEQEGIRVSLRSNARVNVADIAKKFGGGGHKQASGFLIQSGKKVPWKYEKDKKE